MRFKHLKLAVVIVNVLTHCIDTYLPQKHEAKRLFYELRHILIQLINDTLVFDSMTFLLIIFYNKVVHTES